MLPSFVGLFWSLWVAEGRWVCQSFTITEGLSVIGIPLDSQSEITDFAKDITKV